MTPEATERLMAAYLTWRGIPPPRSLKSLIQRTLQPHVPPPQPGTYGNAAVAGMMARGTRLDGSSYSPPGTTATITNPPPRSRATTATRATNVRARTSAATSSTSPYPSTSAPPTPAAEPHQQHAADATRTTGDPAPSRAGTPQSPRQERASKRAAQRQPTQHHAATGSRGHRATPARSGALPGPTNTGAVGTQPGQPPGTAHPHRVPAPSPTGSTAHPTPPREPPQPSPTPRPDPAPRQRLGPRTYGPERRPRRPPHPPTHPPPPPPHPPPNHTNNTPPTPRGLQAIRHHLGPAHHRAPDKSVRPNGRPNDNQHNTTRPQGAGDTEQHLPGAEPYPAPRIRGRWVPSPGSPPAPHTRTGYRPRAPQGARNPQHHPSRLRTAHGRQPAKRQQHRPSRNPARTMAHLTGQQRTQRTRQPTTSPHGHTPLPRPTPPPPGPPTPGTPTPTAPPGA